MSWKIQSNQTDAQQLLLEESLFFTGNGYLGIRGNLEEGESSPSATIRGTYINGFYDHVPIAYGEKMIGFPDQQQTILNLMDTQSLFIWVANDKFTLENGKVLSYERSLDLKYGCHKRAIHWRSPGGIEIKLEFTRIASFVYKNIFEQYITIESLNSAVPVRVESIVNGDVSNFTDPDDPRVAASAEKSLHINKISTGDKAIYMEMKTTASNFTVAALTELAVETVDQENVIYTSTHNHTTGKSTASFMLNKQAIIHKRIIFADSIRHSPIEETIYGLQTQFRELSFSDIALSQHHYLEDFWSHTDITISGDDTLQEAFRFNLYHILQSTGQDGITNIAAKGLSGEGYEGHYFWDTEIYLLPIFTITNPELAKKLLLYRYSILPHAKMRALELGHKQGALFPWRTISGEECSSYFPAGSAQYHISADIAHSYIQYFLATNDLEFMKDAGVEVLIETARLWIDVGHFNDGYFKIDAVTGPDEYTCIVNNNYYTNLMAKQNLEWATKAWKLVEAHDKNASLYLQDKLQLAADELTAFTEAAEQMYLPVDKQLGINPQDDTFLQKATWDFAHTPDDHYPLLLHYHPLTIYRYQVCKQADTVLAHLLVEDGQPEKVIENSYHYYEKVTSHDSSLSACIFSIMAARIGNMDKAYHYFMESARLDLDNTQGNTKDGLHMANMGGTWMAVVVGFAGMRIKESGLVFRPKLPEAWTNYSFRFFYLGSLLKITIQANVCEIELLEGDAVDIFIYNKRLTIKDQTTIQLP